MNIHAKIKNALLDEETFILAGLDKQKEYGTLGDRNSVAYKRSKSSWGYRPWQFVIASVVVLYFTVVLGMLLFVKNDPRKVVDGVEFRKAL
jgi:hypothetical protein